MNYLCLPDKKSPVRKRIRTQNWTHQEKKFLLDLCRKDMEIIENKRLDAGLKALKNKAWKIIHQKFSSQFGTDRTCNRLKEQWRRMKACTSNEIKEYNRLDASDIDRRKSSPFTHEVWNFMQVSKSVCNSKALDGIDYTKIKLALEEDFEYYVGEPHSDDDQDMDDSRTPPQDFCDVDIRFNQTFKNNYKYSLANSGGPFHNGGMNHHRHGWIHNAAVNQNGSFLKQNSKMAGFPPVFMNSMNYTPPALAALNAMHTEQFRNAVAAAAVALQNNLHQVAAARTSHQQQHNGGIISGGGDKEQPPPTKRQRPMSERLSVHGEEQQPHGAAVSTAPNGAASVEAAAAAAASTSSAAGASLGSTNSASSSTSSPELCAFMEMQNKEHVMRMEIMEVQLQAAKNSRDLIEINKKLAVQNLQNYTNKRMAR